MKHMQNEHTVYSRKRLLKLLCVAAIILALGISYYFIIKELDSGIPCLIQTATGLYCPGCGITSMFTALFEGDILTALRSNAFVFFSMPFIIFFAIRWSIDYVKGNKQIGLDKSEKIFLLSFLIVAVLFTVLRNFEFFSFLAPVYD